MTNPLLELSKYGQSIWYDNLNRALIETGDLQKMIDDDGVSGGTSNPTIFEKALSGTDYYDADLQRLREQGADVPTAYDDLTVTDVQLSCDRFLPIYEKTQAADGFCSLEVAPDLAYDTQGSIGAARRLFRSLSRPNAMIKIPGTQQGLPAIEHCLAEGLNINITLLFGVENYEQVAWAYISALEQRAEKGEQIDKIASVASFFLSRVDSMVDAKLDKKIEEASGSGAMTELKALKGKAAIANAKIAYEKYEEIFSSDRWKALEAKGARPQRCLWASTSTKNPDYNDVMYVEELIGPNTVNTVPQSTLDAFRDHGVVEETVHLEVDKAHRTIEQLGEVGIDFKSVTDELQTKGVELFADSYKQATEAIEKAITERIAAG